MALLVDLFGFLNVLLHGLEITAQTIAMGSVIFLALLARPLSTELGAVGSAIIAKARKYTAVAAFSLVLVSGVTGLMQGLVVVGTTGLPILGLFGANFLTAALLKVSAAVGLGILSLSPQSRATQMLEPVFALAILVGATLTSHAIGRLDARAPLAIAEALHQLGAAIWIGGIPCFLAALYYGGDGTAARLIGRRYSLMSMTGVAILFFAGAGLTLPYTGSVAALVGTAYGAMLSTKVIIFFGILMMGGMNYLVVERLRRDPGTPFLRLRRFAEVEIGLGVTIFFVAASLTSLPPAVDLTDDRASYAEIVERLTPRMPSFKSPEFDTLSIVKLQQQIDKETAEKAANASNELPKAYIPGSGVLVERNADDIAWSEYNHHWSGVIVVAIGLMTLLEKTGKARWARHWPLMFLLLAVFLLLRSESEFWPFGRLSFWESARDPEFLQHKIFTALITGFAFFEWSVRTGRLTKPWARYVFPLICAFGGMMLLAHSHSIANVKELLLIEYTHLPLAVVAITSGWARWLEMRLPAPDNKLPGWIWPICFTLVGVILILYRES